MLVTFHFSEAEMIKKQQQKNILIRGGNCRYWGQTMVLCFICRGPRVLDSGLFLLSLLV